MGVMLFVKSVFCDFSRMLEGGSASRITFVVEQVLNFFQDSKRRSGIFITQNGWHSDLGFVGFWLCAFWFGRFWFCAFWFCGFWFCAFCDVRP